MSDPFTTVIIILQPYNSVLSAGLFIVLLSEFFLLRNDIVREKIVKQKIQFSRKFDERFLKIYKKIQISAFTSGLPQRGSYTIRELIDYLISQNPTDDNFLHSMRLSMEKYAYGNVLIDKSQYSIIFKWLSSHKASNLSRARI